MARRSSAHLGPGWLLAAACTLSGCGGAAREARAPAPAFERNPAALIAEIAAARQLPELRPTRVRFYDRDEFAEVLRAQMSRADPDPSADDRGAFFDAFSFPKPTDKTSFEAVQREQVIAFYDDASHTVHVRRADSLSAESRREAEWVLAHEIGHSLQHQHFAMPRLQDAPHEDAFLGGMALVEGDAMLTMLAYAARREFVPLTRALARAENSSNSDEIEAHARKVGGSEKLLDAPLIVQQRLLFPYTGGLTFMGALYRAGGFALVNAAFARPPISTEQILHPEKYLAGELPVPVAALPIGGALESGRMGELQTRVFLTRCVDDAAAERAAAGWGGDSYAVVQQASGTAALLWSTSWDDESEAIEFEAAAAKCAGGTSVRRIGSAVAVARGVPERGRRAVLDLLLQAVRPRLANRPPHGHVQIPPIRRPVPARPAYISDQAWVSERLGIAAPILPEFTPKLDSDELVLSRSFPSPATSYIGLSELVVTPASLERTYREFTAALVEGADGAALVPIGSEQRVSTPLGEAFERAWSFGGSSSYVRLLVVPVCRNTGALLVSQAWSTPEGKMKLDHWVNALKPLRYDVAPPICAELDP